MPHITKCSAVIFRIFHSAFYLPHSAGRNSAFYQQPQITVFTNHPCYDTVILSPNIQTELHGIAVVLLCDELTV